MSVISKVKQNIRDYLTTKYDALYLQELESQVTSYDDWIWEQNNSKEGVTDRLVLDLGKEEKEKQQRRKLVTKISYGQLASFQELSKVCETLGMEDAICVPDAEKTSSEEAAAEKETLVEKGTVIQNLWEEVLIQ